MKKLGEQLGSSTGLQTGEDASVLLHEKGHASLGSSQLT